MQFDLDLVQVNYEGNERRVGFEFESAQLSLLEMAETVRETFGGYIKPIHEFSFEVLDAEFGKFSIESDSNFLKSKKYEHTLPKLSFTSTKVITSSLVGPSRLLVPNEIVTPPIPLHSMDRVENLRAKLHQRIKAKTPIPSLAPCGLHLNPEIEDRSPEYLTRILQAFVVLQDALFEKRRVSLLRKVWPYITPFPDEYKKVLLDKDYNPDFAELLDDYIRFNPTRNRALDLLPIFSWIDEDCLKQYNLAEIELIKGRPAFHYRLPNCDLSKPEWTVAAEWNSWAVVEKLASDSARLEACMRASARLNKTPRDQSSEVSP